MNAWRSRLSLAVCMGAFLLGACDYDHSELSGAPPGAATTRSVIVSELQPGEPHVPYLRADYREDTVAIWEGMRLYNWYNCNGCHLNGGGGIGPPLGDTLWIYGHEPMQVFASIMEGRPQGMPAYAGRISQGEALRIVAYVRSLAGLAERRIDMWPVFGRHMLGATVYVPGSEHVEDLPQPQR